MLHVDDQELEVLTMCMRTMPSGATVHDDGSR